MMRTEFIIEGMTCGHCSATAAKTLLALEGVTRAEVDLSSKIALVEYDESRADEEALFAAIRNVDFTPVKKNG